MRPIGLRSLASVRMQRGPQTTNDDGRPGHTNFRPMGKTGLKLPNRLDYFGLGRPAAWSFTIIAPKRHRQTRKRASVRSVIRHLPRRSHSRDRFRSSPHQIAALLLLQRQGWKRRRRTLQRLARHERPGCPFRRIMVRPSLLGGACIGSVVIVGQGWTEDGRDPHVPLFFF
jgi:hypothetical protein